MKDALGDRMKILEGQESERRFMPQLPICARLDGRSFSRFTKGLNRPFDKTFADLMQDTTSYLVEETNACIGYTQSDEISLIYYSEDPKSQVFFDGRIQKMTSVLAAMCSVKFNRLLEELVDKLDDGITQFQFNEKTTIEDYNERKTELKLWAQKRCASPIFDCRVWTVPTKMEACNTLLWREWDASKNSISMAAREYYSDKELFGKNGSEKQELLFQKGVNWNDYPSFFKRGSYFQRRKVVRKFTTEELDKLPAKHQARTNPNLEVERTEVRALDMPIFNTVVNRVEVVFNGEDPKTV